MELPSQADASYAALLFTQGLGQMLGNSSQITLRAGPPTQRNCLLSLCEAESANDGCPNPVSPRSSAFFEKLAGKLEPIASRGILATVNHKKGSLMSRTETLEALEDGLITEDEALEQGQVDTLDALHERASAERIEAVADVMRSNTASLRFL
ncbi:hypothetical protein [Aureimonas psammosilenae]|uniref:hypothetical protein n=1 Tax=Aureimonas psammosilenae TaxID=2495496 RepID=UPI00186A9A1E|nr:hypothetical protein [Aureimonas psammosilenae]